MKWSERIPILIVILAVSATGWLAVRRSHQPMFSKVLAMGSFHQVAHKGSGTAMLYRLADGRRMLRLDDFSTSQGTDLQVLLVAAPDAWENETIERSGFITLGALPASDRQMVWALPDDLDLNRYRAVTIWNRRYRVNFTTAPLRPLR